MCAWVKIPIYSSSFFAFLISDDQYESNLRYKIMMMMAGMRTLVPEQMGILEVA